MITGWIGATLGACAWCAVRGRGGFFGLVLATLAGVVGAALGWFAAQALAEAASPALLASGAFVGGLLLATATVVTWGPRPKMAPTSDTSPAPVSTM